MPSLSVALKWFGLFMIIFNGTTLILFTAPGPQFWLLLAVGVLAVVTGFLLGRRQPPGGGQS